MEAEILKIICANQGAVDTDDLLYNLFFHDPSKVSEIICNREKFASCCPNGQPKVVARTRLRLCRHKDCPGTCRSLHLCKNFLFSGFCHLTGLRRGCSFSHELNSDHNQRLLTEHELESLSREELCTLLLQSDTLLPEICHDYNNGDGEFGKCNDGDGCKRLHICEQYVRGECSCLKNHSFSAPQPLKILREKNIPGTLFQSLKPVYANREALRLAVVNERGQQRGRGRGRGRGGNQGNRGGNQGNRGGNQGNKSGNQGNRGGRGTRGSRGNRGNQSGHPVQHRTSSLSDLFAKIDTLSLYTSDGLNEDDGKSSPSSDVSAAANDTDASSENGETRRRRRRPKNVSADVRGRGGNRGNHQPLQKTRSSSDIHAAVGDEAAKGGKGQDKRQRCVRDKTEICMYFIKGHCIHEDRCFKAHDKMPYRWEVQQGVQWTALPENETIERDYCDPSKSYSSTSPPVYFGTMTCGSDKVRRLSTENSVIEPTFIHTTEWLWYWEDEFGKWNSYSSDTGGHKPADINSTKLEEKFLTDDKDVVEFTAGSQSYSLSFQDMIQTNKRYGTKKLVCRRPRFVSAADVLTKKVRRPLVQTSAPIPDNWDKTQIPETGYSKISLQRSSAEFKEVEGRFCKTVRGFDMVSIERIQNKALWEVFQWQKNQMKSKSGGGNVTERKLFHGTDSKFVDTICHHNFDWRICGTHGTAFGKGSYFARDAKYSHNYTGDTDVRTMFISRVLVGDYTRGSSDYRRPPSKDGGDINFYDSCVDDEMNPSIFVVFEKHQIYPEYLLQYKTTYSVGVAPAPKPAAAPKSVSIQSAYQPSTASFQYQTHTSYSLFPPNTASSISQSNKTSSISQSSMASNISQYGTNPFISWSNTTPSISQSSTASSISQSNTASSISQSNTASSISQSNTASSISQSNTASSISQSNTASSISRSNTAFSGYQPSTASNISQYGTDPFISLSNRTSSISRSNTASSISRSNTASSISRSNTASSGYQPSTASNISQYGTDPFISLSNRTSSISRSSTASSRYLSSPVSRPKKSSNSCVIA